MVAYWSIPCEKLSVRDRSVSLILPGCLSAYELFPVFVDKTNMANMQFLNPIPDPEYFKTNLVYSSPFPVYEECVCVWERERYQYPAKVIHSTNKVQLVSLVRVPTTQPKS